MDKLLPCPFCGGEPFDMGGDHYCCSTSGCPLEELGNFTSIHIDNWNQRADRLQDQKPKTSLARRDAEKQAEALEQAADELGNNAGGEIDYSELMARADRLRRNAENEQ